MNSTIFVLCHGGPIAEPEDAAYVLSCTKGIVGFFSASSMERLPTEVAITKNTRRFKRSKLIRPNDFGHRANRNLFEIWQAL
ncbi:MAG: hypothetical protein NVS4B11_18830 [Ktedonobacteraceae bacterium]